MKNTYYISDPCYIYTHTHARARTESKFHYLNIYHRRQSSHKMLDIQTNTEVFYVHLPREEPLHSQDTVVFVFMALGIILQHVLLSQTSPPLLPRFSMTEVMLPEPRRKHFRYSRIARILLQFFIFLPRKQSSAGVTCQGLLRVRNQLQARVCRQLGIVIVFFVYRYPRH